jgi:serine protease inhibitor
LFLGVDKRLGAEVVELPYVGGDISMLVLLPIKDMPSAVQDLVKKLDGKALQALVQALASKEATGPKRTIIIPKFTMESELDLTSVSTLVIISNIHTQ